MPLFYYFKGDASTVRVLETALSRNAILYVASVSEVELFGFPKLKAAEAKNIEAFLTVATVIPLDSRIARFAGALRSSYRIGLPDSVIAATALATGSTLLTRNVRDFKKIPELSVRAV